MKACVTKCYPAVLKPGSWKTLKSDACGITSSIVILNGF
jgi:hypothetical protein